MGKKRYLTLQDIGIDPYEQGKRHGTDGIKFYPPGNWSNDMVSVSFSPQEHDAYVRGYSDGAKAWGASFGKVREWQTKYIQEGKQ